MTVSTCVSCGDPLTISSSGEFCSRCAGRLLLDVTQSEVNPNASHSPAASLRLGDYELGVELGRGAMGVVYRARQTSLKREVAVKVILASRFASESARKRFLAEAELAAQLDHPNIVPIYEVGETKEGPFYAMKLVEGGTLAQKVSDFGFRVPGSETVEKHRDQLGTSNSKPEASAALLAKIARAVHHAHQRGVLHRDLKPGNILIDAGGEPHIADFGLARQLGVESSLTLSGSTLGTPAYMAPEQAAGERRITTAADVWSLGAIFFHLLAGRPPFIGESVADILLQARTQEPPSLRALNAAVPRDLETICLKCLEKDPASRYASALALAEDLERWLKHEPIRARPTSPTERLVKWARRRPAIAAFSALTVILFIAGVAGIGWQWRRAETNAKESRQRLVRMATATAIHRIEERDFLGALPWFVEALRLENSSLRTPGSVFDRSLFTSAATEKEIPHRIRFATTLRQAPRLAQVWFHDGAVKYAEFSPDGRRVATASKDGTARVWDALTGEPVTPPLRHARGVNQAVFSPEGQRIATASGDGTARMWDAQNGAPLTAPMVHGNDRDVFLALSPDGNILVTAARHSIPVFWNSRTGERLATVLQTEGAVDYMLFKQEKERLLILGFDQQRARLWDAVTGKAVSPALKNSLIRTVAGGSEGRVATGGDGGAMIYQANNYAALTVPLKHDGPVAHVEFSPDGTRIVTASFDGTARVWDAFTGQPITPRLQHNESVHHAAFSPDGRWVVTSSEDHSARVWDATRGTALFPPLWHGHAVKRAVFSPDGRCILTSSLDGSVRLWNVTTAGPSSVSLAGESKFKDASLHRQPMRATSISRDNTVQVWNALNGEALGPPLKHNSTCSRAELSPDGARVATGSHQTVKVWEITTGKLVSQVPHRKGEMGRFIWRPDGQAMLSWGADDNEARMWDPETGLALGPLIKHGDQITHAAFSPDGERLATASNGGTTRIWDVHTGQPITPVIRHGGPLNRVRFSPDGTRIVTCSDDGTARLWDATTGEQVTPPLRHGGWVSDAAFSPDGRRIMTSSEDGTARVWDSTTGRPLTAPLRLGGGVAKPSFSADGRMVLAGNGHVAQVWDAETGTPLSPPLSALAIGFDAIFSRDERSVMAVTFDRRVVSWDITPFDWPLEDLAAAARLLSCREIDVTGALVPLEQMLEGTNGAAFWVETAKTNRQEAIQNSGPGPANARALLRRDWARLRDRLSPKPTITAKE